MSHFRYRHLQTLLHSTLAYSPIVGVFGHRQVGKTTLVSRVAKRYQTMDDAATLEHAFDDGRGFLAAHQGGLLAIDECQLAPPLFPALKEWVRTHPRPGQFLLSGSVRFSSRKMIRESLVGRIISWELLPMDLSETFSKPLRDSLPKFLAAATTSVDVESSAYFSIPVMTRALDQGGLPGIFAIRSAAIRAQRFETQLNAMLERDLKLVIQTSLGYRALKGLVSELALMQGEPLDLASLSRKCRISIPTLRKLIVALEAIFFIRLIPTKGSEKKPVLFLEDQGEASYLSGGKYGELFNLTRFLYAQLRTQVHYRPELGVRVFQFRNRGGSHVPLCFEGKNSVLGIIPVLDPNALRGPLATARSFLKTFPRAKVLIVHSGKEGQVISPSIRVLSVANLV